MPNQLNFLKDGYSAIIVFPGIGNIEVYEKEVTPPAYETGEINTTTMRNLAVVTKWTKALLELQDVTVNAAYSQPAYAGVLYNNCGINQSIEIYWPDIDGGSSNNGMSFWGFIKRVKPGGMKDGEQPMIELVITPTNMDSSHNESPPVALS